MESRWSMTGYPICHANNTEHAHQSHERPDGQILHQTRFGLVDGVLDGQVPRLRVADA